MKQEELENYICTYRKAVAKLPDKYRIPILLYYMGKLTPENIDEYAVPVESTRQICTINGEKNVHYSYTYESDGTATSGIGSYAFDELFPEHVSGEKCIMGSNYSGLADLLIEVFVLNEDGTITFVLYQPRG